MRNLFNENIRCTDPDTLQFCLPVSENKFWYCEPNGYNDSLLPYSKTPESRILEKYLGYPQKMLEDAKADAEIKSFVENRRFWLNGTIDVRDFSKEEKREMIESCGVGWNDFNSNAERNQIICEIYFECYPMDFRNGI
jgi:hypothetical protein